SEHQVDACLSGLLSGPHGTISFQNFSLLMRQAMRSVGIDGSTDSNGRAASETTIERLRNAGIVRSAEKRRGSIHLPRDAALAAAAAAHEELAAARSGAARASKAGGAREEAALAEAARLEGEMGKVEARTAAHTRLALIAPSEPDTWKMAPATPRSRSATLSRKKTMPQPPSPPCRRRWRPPTCRPSLILTRTTTRPTGVAAVAAATAVARKARAKRRAAQEAQEARGGSAPA
ncbi:MAG: hypothetical protein VX017_09990, partial [Pseudomonadota bacterium]|nr:hypothetical protein [Pseudomonadota bacterium]